MIDMSELKDDLVTANRILAAKHVLDSFGHVAIRHPERPDHFLLSRARAPNCVDLGDIMEFSHSGETIGRAPGKPYAERFIHGAVFEARPEIMAVVHSHSPSVVPFSVQSKRLLRPILHMAATIGYHVPTWDIADHFGVTNLLVTSVDMGRDFARTLGGGNCALMRGHGSVIVGRSLREAVFSAIYMELNADMLIKALSLGDGEIRYLSEEEIGVITRARANFTLERGWENWCREVDRPYFPQSWDFGQGFSRTDKN
jgi:HCOMODA/2-hydroxy-3-carboxy-muconic semialdehyde decarboxylase